jgi:hypothetical protein
MAFADLMPVMDRAVVEQLGGTVHYAPSVGDAIDVQGVFDAAYVKVDAGGQAGVSSCGPAVFLLLDDLPASPNPVDDSPIITIDSIAYQAAEAQPDGKGGVLFHLHLA